ncbi:MAG: hypothetical protein EOO50_07365 [Flavobacterium sp.]|uniref:kelch repeat-containing protein n=1 Tax=Flavobacterium sp. TaxID=239 RepID=UPI001213F21D|nr:kelch repeat-containing protein [Flavobacterium sp.]RZJ67073.1 MAG: hypothetical protein EOO50_07365 [Flavobacterium sp.]
MRYLFCLFMSFALYSCAQDDSETPFQNTADEVFSFEVDSINLDMIAAPDGNSLYVTYSADNGLNENLTRFNLQSGSQTTVVHPDLSEGRKLVILGDYVYSVGNVMYRASLDLAQVEVFGPGIGSIGANSPVSDGTNIFYVFGYESWATFDLTTGEPDLQNDNWNLWRTGSASCFRQEKIYLFGGHSGNANDGFEIFDSIFIYDTNDNSWSQNTLPFAAFETFSASYGGQILLAGNKFSDGSGAFIGIYDTQSATFVDTPISLDLQNISIRSIAAIGDDFYVAYVELENIGDATMTVKVVKLQLP